MKPFERIVVALDFSEHSREALRIAVDLARQYQSSLTLVHAHQPDTYSLPDGSMLLTPQQFERLVCELEQYLESSQKEALRLGAPSVSTRLLGGFAGSEIVSFANQTRSDLIVMGTHGRGGLGRLLLGSVAEVVVRTAACPVLTVRARATASR